MTRLFVSMPVWSKWVWLALALVGLWGYARLFEWRNVFHPSSTLRSTPADMGMTYEDVVFVTEDDCELHGWWVPAEGARGTLIFCHGNAGNIGDRVELVFDLRRLGVNVFIFDYRGYGQSSGFPTEKGLYRDARAAFEVVRARHGDSEAPPIVAYGRSLGGAVAVQLACDKPVRGLIVESSFSSAVDVGRHWFPILPVNLMCRYRFDSLSKAVRLTMPKLFSHSRTDEVVPYELGRRLYEAAPAPKEFVELAGGHNDVAWATTPEYLTQLRWFLDSLFPAQSEGSSR